jgi:hypothetical protein
MCDVLPCQVQDQGQGQGQRGSSSSSNARHHLLLLLDRELDLKRQTSSTIMGDTVDKISRLLALVERTPKMEPTLGLLGWDEAKRSLKKPMASSRLSLLYRILRT